MVHGAIERRFRETGRSARNTADCRRQRFVRIRQGEEEILEHVG